MNNKYPIKPAYILNSFITVSLSLLTLIIKSPDAIAAEKVKLIYGPFSGRVSVASLEKYAQTGEITHEFKLYSKFLDKEALAKLRYWLSSRFGCDRVELYKFTNTTEGEKFLQELGTAIKTHPKRNGFYAIRSALIEAADKPDNSDGWTIIEAMYNFPTEDLQINTKDLFALQKFWSDDHSNHQAALEIFAPQSKL